MSACVCVCACVSPPTSLNGVEEVSGWGNRRGERDISVVVAPGGRIRCRLPRGRRIRKKQQKEQNWNRIKRIKMESSYFNASLAVNESEKDNNKKKCLFQTSTWSTSLSEWRTPKVWGCRRILLMHNSPALWCLRSQRFMASRSAAAPVISPLLFSCASFNVWRVTGRRCQQSMGAFLGLIMSSNAQFVLNSSEWRHCVRARGGVHGTTYPTPPFLFDLAHLSCAVSGSLLELPPWWLCPLDGEGGGGGGWGGRDGRDGRGAMRVVVWGGVRW